MYQQDYILRLIEQMGALLRRLRDAMREGRPEEALEEAEEALQALTGVRPSLADALSAGSLLTLLGAPDRLDVLRCIALAEVLAVRAEALDLAGREAEATRQRERAIVVLEAAVAASDGELREQAGELLAEIRA